MGCRDRDSDRDRSRAGDDDPAGDRTGWIGGGQAAAQRLGAGIFQPERQRKLATPDRKAGCFSAQSPGSEIRGWQDDWRSIVEPLSGLGSSLVSDLPEPSSPALTAPPHRPYPWGLSLNRALPVSAYSGAATRILCRRSTSCSATVGPSPVTRASRRTSRGTRRSAVSALASTPRRPRSRTRRSARSPRFVSSTASR